MLLYSLYALTRDTWCVSYDKIYHQSDCPKKESDRCKQEVYKNRTGNVIPNAKRFGPGILVRDLLHTLRYFFHWADIRLNTLNTLADLFHHDKHE